METTIKTNIATEAFEKSIRIALEMALASLKLENYELAEKMMELQRLWTGKISELDPAKAKELKNELAPSIKNIEESIFETGAKQAVIEAAEAAAYCLKDFEDKTTEYVRQ